MSTRTEDVTPTDLARYRWHVETFPDGKTDFGSADVARLLAAIDSRDVAIGALVTAVDSLKGLQHPPGGCASGCGYCAGQRVLNAARAIADRYRR